MRMADTTGHDFLKNGPFTQSIIHNSQWFQKQF